MNSIYLDHAATTPVRPEVFEAMRPLLTERFGNPSSIHRYGREARGLLEQARERVAGALGAERREILFTSGGTEADNLAVLGGARALGTSAVRIAISAIEHKAVFGAARQAAHEGAELVVVAVDEDGTIDLDALDHALRRDLNARVGAICAVMLGNNEVGTIQPVDEVARICRAHGALYHCDAVQGFGRVPVRVDRVAFSTLAISGHKIGAPKGIGALFVRTGTALEALTHGGGQERDLRPGTENIAGAVALGLAAELAVRDLEVERERLRALRTRLEHELGERVSEFRINAGGAERLPHVLNVSIRQVDQEALLVSLDLEGVAVSSGSACQSGTVEPSHVLSAMGRARPDEASIRLSLGRTTTDAEITQVIDLLPRVIGKLRSPALATGVS
jgi:cysteine desulfurase